MVSSYSWCSARCQTISHKFFLEYVIFNIHLAVTKFTTIKYHSLVDTGVLYLLR